MRQTDTVFFGVDFSGAAQPGEALWISKGEANGELLSVIDSRPAWEWFDLQRSASRARLYEALREFIVDHPNGVFGFDFPFSLPRQIHTEDSWREHIQTLPESFRIDDPDEFRKECTERAEQATDSEVSHLRRETDFRYGAQCPYQRQIQHQTMYGQSELLRPMVEEDEVRVLPMQERAPDLPVLIEVYPAATLGRYRTYRIGYKNHPTSRKRRRRILGDLTKEGLQVPEKATERCINSDDALDSVICAIAGFHAHSSEYQRIENTAAIEGQIFA